jgi:hypothetical protein
MKAFITENVLACGWVALCVGCAVPRPNTIAGGQSAELATDPAPAWPFYVTITPEQIMEAQSARDCQPADQDPAGHWGFPAGGLQVSIRLQKDSFVAGESVVACVTLRNVSEKPRYFLVSKYRKEEDTKIVLMHGQERVLGVDDPKPGESFQQRLRHLRQGTYFEKVLMPGTQCQFNRDLTRMFNLSVAGIYSARAERPAVTVADGPVSYTNLLSEAVTFRIGESRSKDAR